MFKNTVRIIIVIITWLAVYSTQQRARYLIQIYQMITKVLLARGQQYNSMLATLPLTRLENYTGNEGNFCLPNSKQFTEIDN